MPEPPFPAAAFLFDLDGVLVDSRALVRAGWLALAAERGLGLTEADLAERCYGRRTLDVLVDVFGLELHEAEALVRAGIDDKTAELEAGAQLPAVPGARAFVLAARARAVPCALVTSASPANRRLALGRLGLCGAFDAVIDAEHTGRGKPSPDPYLLAAGALGVPPSACVVFEDTPAGVSAAKRAGARCVALTTTVDRALLAAADLIVDDFTALLGQEHGPTG